MPMTEISEIHQGKTPIRRHFLKEWMEVRDIKPKVLADGLDVDKSQVYRWFKGQMPQPKQQALIAEALNLENPDDLLRHPDDDWISRFLQNRSKEEVESIKQVLELSFPRKTGTN